MSIALDMDASAKMRKQPGSSGWSTSSTPSCSVIVPAFRENLNLRPLVTRLSSAFASQSSSELANTEIIIVDDNSRDGSVETVSALQSEGYNVRIIVRTSERGLSSAVVRGFREARGQRMICMDADLQHPPEAVPSLLLALNGQKSFVLGTRYGVGVSMDKDWPLHRRIISSGARMLARPLTSASDPMSGFFGITKHSFHTADHHINAQGFKIALDLLVKSGVHSTDIAEVPFSFGLRQEGESKLDGKVMFKYLQQLVELYRFRFGTVPIVFVLIVLLVLALYIWSHVLAPMLGA
ncbi:dolichyl-phosphate beta-D-mannosyltransferase [Mycosarcoma maydis]|uniref:Dolichol-phosphate mannosyltransferase n=1 Tax=Mycosarcoma maydis TaxID=5270 RepID=DPM1_MYCMD|nr:dolichyl-phosphate beta-D-mannosyltransferase [Ustilago maydis 521]P54856.2 RecName: Full=Dolichol-phosphate mannosyltransferase; AltName: Full=Dolichol-phosphate mannose synthase; Short=DPM synthase; AltName: Full=Dolichyl-phosphate beta-D-mannosyltransferase; AltName: Full=Mannose-P-dolichol synthase; Short=MPD synthase [Ustilago maydis 521]KIS70243.1 dolichyl-phosphate beta-D-mannosyltransferase [Ustilago maydis 521]|eukprot:XP_011388316.1 dolichyl-phosphate beta-D-mannosyltransferase [Ustilago maydis 521]